MILDGENLFFKKQNLSNSTITSDVLDVGPGEASDNLHLVANVSKDAGNGSVTLFLDTSKTSTFTTSVTIASFPGKTYTSLFPISSEKGPAISAKLPRGNQGYLRVRAQSTFAKGTITAGLVMDDDVPWEK